MKNQTHLVDALTAATFLLVGTLAIAQTTPRTKTASSPSSQSSGIAVDHAGGNGVRRAIGTQHGTVQSGTTTTASPTAATTRQRKHLAGVKYADRSEPGNTGQNPLYESKDKANSKPPKGTTPSHQ